MPRLALNPGGAAALAIVTAQLLAACGGTVNNSNGGSSASNRSLNQAQIHSQMVRFATCMRENGVPSFPDPGAGGQGGIEIQRTGGPNGGSATINGVQVAGATLQNAMQKCQRFQPTPPPMTHAQIAQIRAQGIAMARCMRGHGVPNFPDPQIGTGPGGHGLALKLGSGVGGGGSGSQLNPNSPAFQTAMQQCKPKGSKGPDAGFAIAAGPAAGSK